MWHAMGKGCVHMYSPLPHPMQSDSDSEGYTRYRQRLQTKGAKLYAQMASGFSRKSQHFKSKFGGFLTTPKKQAGER